MYCSLHPDCGFIGVQLLLMVMMAMVMMVMLMMSVMVITVPEAFRQVVWLHQH
jgi:hypothetical protein